MGRGRSSKNQRPTASPPQAAAVGAKRPTRRVWLGLGALAFLVIAAGIGGFYSSDAPPDNSVIALAESTSCPTTNLRRLTINRAGAIREIAKTPAYTQGLIFAGGHLYESTGQKGRSAIYRLAIDGGERSELARLDKTLFGEGLAKLGEHFYQLTWQAGLAFAYQHDPEQIRLERVDTFRREGQGWGLTNHGDELILSDGSDTLSFVAPETFAVNRAVSVRLAGERLDKLNELEFVRGEVLAKDIVRTLAEAWTFQSSVEQFLKRQHATSVGTSAFCMKAQSINGAKIRT